MWSTSRPPPNCDIEVARHGGSGQEVPPALELGTSTMPGRALARPSLLIDKHLPEILAGSQIEMRPTNRESSSAIHISTELPLPRPALIPIEKMATVYKSLSKSSGPKDDENSSHGPRKNKQRVLALSSRGVTYR